jgi:hypothetical protein
VSGPPLRGTLRQIGATGSQGPLDQGGARIGRCTGRTGIAVREALGQLDPRGRRQSLSRRMLEVTPGGPWRSATRGTNPGTAEHCWPKRSRISFTSLKGVASCGLSLRVPVRSRSVQEAVNGSGMLATSRPTDSQAAEWFKVVGYARAVMQPQGGIGHVAEYRVGGNPASRPHPPFGSASSDVPWRQN